jgi:hypothetical protein
MGDGREAATLKQSATKGNGLCLVASDYVRGLEILKLQIDTRTP